MTAWVVMADQGCYMDRNTWVDSVWLDEQDARTYVARAAEEQGQLSPFDNKIRYALDPHQVRA